MSIGKNIDLAKKILESGDLVAIPTETVYGLAGNAFDENAITKIFETKNRPFFDPLIVHTYSVSEFKHLAIDIPNLAFKLAEKFCPGPLTFILKKSKKIPLLATAGNETVGVRIPNHSLTLELLQKINFPLAAPSANPFGYVSPTNPFHVENQLGNKLKYILDGGNCKIGIESTIVDLSLEKPIILRLGGLEIEAIEETIKQKIQVKTSSSNPKAPGMLSVHYAPKKKVILGEIESNLKKFHAKKIAILAFQKTYSSVNKSHQIQLSKNGNLKEAAKNLFSALRKFDEMDIEYILTENLPDEGLGKAINDRLKRASV